MKLAKKIVTALCTGALLFMGGTSTAIAAPVIPPAAVQASVSNVSAACGNNDICLIRAAEALRAQQIAVSPEKVYVVQANDYLSSIAPKEHTDAESLYCNNRKVIGSNPNIIRAGQKLAIPTSKMKCQGFSFLSSVSSPSPVVYNGSGGSGRLAAFQACVISRESGGNTQVMNASDHYGLYQFSYSTWVGYGGDGNLFGPPGWNGGQGGASAAYQTHIFYNAMANPFAGAMNWTPYDGCVY